MVISVSAEGLRLKRKNIYCMHRVLAPRTQPKAATSYYFFHEAKRQNPLQINSGRPCSAKPQGMKNTLYLHTPGAPHYAPSHCATAFFPHWLSSRHSKLFTLPAETLPPYMVKPTTECGIRTYVEWHSSADCVRMYVCTLQRPRDFKHAQETRMAWCDGQGYKRLVHSAALHESRCYCWWQ